MADFDEPGHEDVVKKIFHDFQIKNIDFSYEEVKEKLLDFEKEALKKLSD